MSINQGTYVARAVEFDLGSTDKGVDYVAVQFRIEEGETAGQRVTWYGYFTDKTEQRVIESLRYCGWDGIDFANLGGLDKNLVQLVIAKEEYQGKWYTKVEWVNRLGGLAIKNQMDPARRAAFAARMKAVALSVPKDLAKGTAAPAQSQAKQSSRFDDIPPHSEADMPPHDDFLF